jgi:hypothetical protein
MKIVLLIYIFIILIISCTSYKLNSVRKTSIDFINNSLPYLEKILSKDETFFSGNDKPDILKQLKVELWWNSNLSEKTKATIWKYIKSFFAVGIKAVQVPKEYLPIIEYIINNE